MEGSREQALEDRIQVSGTASGIDHFAELVEDLILTDDHGVSACRDSYRVTTGGAVIDLDRTDGKLHAIQSLDVMGRGVALDPMAGFDDETTSP